MIGTRYVHANGLWVPSYTIGDGVGDAVARLAYRLGFRQTPGCGCSKIQRRLNPASPRRYAIAGGSGGSTEDLCTTLGSSCLCGEPLNTNTHDGGSANWPTSGERFFNFDDSPSATECWPTLNGENYCNSQFFAPLAVSAEAGKLPSGHTLSYVMHHIGVAACHVTHPAMVEAPDVTYCARAYRRWDASQEAPLATEPPDPPAQQKVLTIGGAPSGTNDFLNAQISLDVGGDLHTRFDGVWFDSPNDFQSLGNLTDCKDNYCRFEICVDYSAIGEGRVRMRRTKVSPGDGSTNTVFKPIGNTLRPGGISFVPQPNGVSLYAQTSVVQPNFIGDSYNTHFLVTHVRPENRNFWIGPACEVEGGCAGGGGIKVALRHRK